MQKQSWQLGEAGEGNLIFCRTGELFWVGRSAK